MEQFLNLQARTRSALLLTCRGRGKRVVLRFDLANQPTEVERGCRALSTTQTSKQPVDMYAAYRGNPWVRCRAHPHANAQACEYVVRQSHSTNASRVGKNKVTVVDGRELPGRVDSVGDSGFSGDRSIPRSSSVPDIILTVAFSAAAKAHARHPERGRMRMAPLLFDRLYYAARLLFRMV